MGSGSRRLLLVVGILVLVALVVPALGWGMMGGVPGMMGSWGAQPFWVFLLGALSMVAFWGALIAGIVLLVRWLGGPPIAGGHAREDTALDILRRRYAAGEITREEYEQMRRVLSQ